MHHLASGMVSRTTVSNISNNNVNNNDASVGESLRGRTVAFAADTHFHSLNRVGRPTISFLQASRLRPQTERLVRWQRRNNEYLKSEQLSAKERQDLEAKNRRNASRWAKVAAHMTSAGIAVVFQSLAESMLGPTVQSCVIPEVKARDAKAATRPMLQAVENCGCAGCASRFPAAAAAAAAPTLAPTPELPTSEVAATNKAEYPAVAEPMAEDWMSLADGEDVPFVVLQASSAAEPKTVVTWTEMHESAESTTPSTSATSTNDMYSNNKKKNVSNNNSNNNVSVVNNNNKSSNDIQKAQRKLDKPTSKQRIDKESRSWEAKLSTGASPQELIAFLVDQDFCAQVLAACFRDVSQAATAAADAYGAIVKLIELSDSVPEARDSAVAAAKRWGYDVLARQLTGDGSGPDRAWIEDSLRKHSCELPRAVGQPDARVRSFRPDDWQRRLLDLVDARRSAVVVAPTSAGKTFIQYYAMEQVLREENDGVVVYVCPTKALCNQVVAGASARFKKNYPHNSKVVVGLFTRDERRNEDKCQILVTVPQCLEILLLAPTPEAQEWAARIRWVIFDELHCLNEPLNGGVWERLLQLTTCPFLALSATIGEPATFAKWLSQTRSTPVELITHDERYNDLRMWVATTSEGQPRRTLLHPLTLVTLENLQTHGCPPLAEFESHDAWDLFKIMQGVFFGPPPVPPLLRNTPLYRE